ncbi:hypothetical protein FKW77_002559 [Venturia effusa]|uniref:C-type lectin domain-containing protein n=1 Tax=Venturia effusa TaxID=50376 RepID=A0A517LC13_9PEZI|nr:hypothetical protein FKW77_002559 [Venturia effusa]
MIFMFCARVFILARCLEFAYADVPTISYYGMTEIPKTLVPNDLPPSGVFYAVTPEDNGVDLYLGQEKFQLLRNNIFACRHAMTQKCQETLMSILGTTGTSLEKRLVGLIALAIIEAPIIFVMIAHLFHNEEHNIPHTTNIHIPGSALNGAASALTASTFVVKASSYQQQPENHWTTESTVTRTLTTATAAFRAPLVTQYAGQEPVLLLLPEDLAVRMQDLLERSASPTCGQLSNLKRQAFSGGEELCGFLGVAGAAQPGLDLETFQLMQNPMNWQLNFPRADLVQIWTAALDIMRDMIGAPEQIRNRVVLAAPFIFGLVLAWVENKQRVAVVNTISSAWLNTVTNRPTPTTTSMTSSSSSSSSKKPCRTDVLEPEGSSRMKLSGKIDMECGIAEYHIYGHYHQYEPDCGSMPTVPMDPDLFRTAYGIACNNLGNFLEKDMAQTIDTFGGYKAKSPIRGPEDYNFEFRWTRKEGTCKENNWWTEPSQECRSWYGRFVENELCFDKDLSALKQYGKVDFECGIAEYYVDNHAADEKSTGGFVDPWRVRTGLAKCSGETQVINTDLWLLIANKWCEFLGDGFSTKTFTKLWTKTDWGKDMEKFPDEWSSQGLDNTYSLRWKAKVGPACEVGQRPGFYKDMCVNTYMALHKSKHCQGQHGDALQYGTIEVLCGSAWYYIAKSGFQSDKEDLEEIKKGIPYDFTTKNLDVLNSFWKLTTHLSWNSVVEGGRTALNKEGKWTIVVTLFDLYQSTKGSFTISEKHSGDKRMFVTPTGNLTLMRFEFNPDDKQQTPVMQWWWNSNTTAPSVGLRRGDGMIFKNQAWNDQSPDGGRLVEGVDEPYMDDLNSLIFQMCRK